MTKLCVPIMVDSADQALADAHAAKATGADLVELRLDRFTDDRDAAAKLVEQCPLPTLVTIRPNWEGGEYDGDDMHRISLIEYLGTTCTGPAYFDVELAAYDRSAVKEALERAKVGADPPRTSDSSFLRLLASYS